MIEENDLVAHVRECLEPADFQDARVSRIVNTLFKLVEEGKRVEANTLLNHIEDRETLRCICESAFMPEGGSRDHRQRVVADCIKRLKSQKVISRRKELHDRIRSAQHSGDHGSVHKLIQEFHALIKKEGTDEKERISS